MPKELDAIGSRPSKKLTEGVAVKLVDVSRRSDILIGVIFLEK